MKKKILILHTNMELGGAETSLLGLLWSLDYDRVSVDLFRMRTQGSYCRCCRMQSVCSRSNLPIGRSAIRYGLQSGRDTP